MDAHVAEAPSLDDLELVLDVLERAAARGCFLLSEFEQIGRLYSVLQAFLVANGRGGAHRQ